MKSFKNFTYFLFILLFLSCSSQITDATKTDFSVSINFSSIIESQKQNNSRSVTNQNGSIEFKLYDVTNLQLSQNEKFEDVENLFQQDNIEPLFQEKTVIVNQKAQVQFKEVDVGIKALILVECTINNADDSIFYNGKSNIFEIKAGENPVTITLSKVVVADPDPDPEPDPDPDPDPEPEPEQQVTLTFIVDGVETNLEGTPGESLTKDSPEKQGYTFVEWEPELPRTFPNSNETYTAKWTPNTNTPYKINYFEESLNGTDELYDSETATGTTDEETNINPPPKEGFDVSVNNSNIASDGSTVVKVYYKRKTVKLTFMNDNVIFGSVTGKYGYPITTPQPAPTKEGFTFDGWDSIPSTFPATDATYYAIWKKIINFDIRYPEYQEPGVGIEYEKNDNNTITFTPGIPEIPEDGYLYEWYLDGSKQSSESSYTFTPDTAGVYCIMLITTINDVPYSSTVTVDVTM